MDKAEFERGYAERSGMTVDELHDLGLRAEPCDCGEDCCGGWKVTGGKGEATDANDGGRTG